MERTLNLYEFSDYELFVKACKKAKESSSEFQIYTPIADEDLMELISPDTRMITTMGTAGAVFGFLLGIGLQIIPNVWLYPQNIGGRPLLSLPAFVPVCFELTILFASLGIVSGFLISNKYPRFDRAVFGSADFNNRRHKHYFLCTTKELPNVSADTHSRITDD